MATLFATNDFASFNIVRLTDVSMVTTTVANGDSTIVPEVIQIITDQNDPTPAFDFRLPKNPTGIMWFHCHFKCCGFQSDSRLDGYFFEFFDTNDNLVASANMTNGRIQALASGDSVVGGTVVGLTNNSLFKLDIKVDVNPTDITIEIYRNSILISNATAANTGGKVLGTYIRAIADIGFGTSFDGFAHISQMIITEGDESTFSYNLFEIEPDTIGFHDSWNGSYADIIGTNQVTNISSDVVNSLESWYKSSVSFPVGYLVNKVVSVFSGTTDNTESTGAISGLIRIGGTDYFNSLTDIGDSVSIHTVEYANNPDTLAAWSNSDFASTIEFGVRADS